MAASVKSRRACGPSFVFLAKARSWDALKSPRNDTGIAMTNLHRSPPMNQSKTDLGIVNESQLLRFGISLDVIIFAIAAHPPVNPTHDRPAALPNGKEPYLRSTNTRRADECPIERPWLQFSRWRQHNPLKPSTCSPAGTQRSGLGLVQPSHRRLLFRLCRRLSRSSDQPANFPRWSAHLPIRMYTGCLSCPHELAYNRSH